MINFFVFQVSDLKPDTSYIFLVRAENSNGLSSPSPLSDHVRTLGADMRAVSQSELDEARSRLSTKVVELRHIEAISSTSVRLNWKVRILTFCINKKKLVVLNAPERLRPFFFRFLQPRNSSKVCTWDFAIFLVDPRNTTWLQYSRAELQATWCRTWKNIQNMSSS